MWWWTQRQSPMQTQQTHKLYLQNVNARVNSTRDSWLGDLTWQGCNGLMQWTVNRGQVGSGELLTTYPGVKCEWLSLKEESVMLWGGGGVTVRDEGWPEFQGILWGVVTRGQVGAILKPHSGRRRVKLGGKCWKYDLMSKLNWGVEQFHDQRAVAQRKESNGLSTGITCDTRDESLEM